MRRTLENTFQTSARPRGTRPTAKDKRPGLQRPASRHHLRLQARLQVYGASSHVPRAASGVGEIARSSPRSGQAAGPHRGGCRARAPRSVRMLEPDRGPVDAARHVDVAVVSGCVRLSCPDPEKRMWVHTPEIPGAGTYRQPCVQALRVRVSTAGRRYGPFERCLLRYLLTYLLTYLRSIRLGRTHPASQPFSQDSGAPRCSSSTATPAMNRSCFDPQQSRGTRLQRFSQAANRGCCLFPLRRPLTLLSSS